MRRGGGDLSLVLKQTTCWLGLELSAVLKINSELASPALSFYYVVLRQSRGAIVDQTVSVVPMQSNALLLINLQISATLLVYLLPSGEEKKKIPPYSQTNLCWRRKVLETSVLVLRSGSFTAMRWQRRSYVQSLGEMYLEL